MRPLACCTFYRTPLKLDLPIPRERPYLALEGLTNSPQVKMPMLVLRRDGSAARFLTVIEPADAAGPIRAVKLETANGEPAVLVLDSSAGSRRVSLR